MLGTSLLAMETRRCYLIESAFSCTHGSNTVWIYGGYYRISFCAIYTDDILRDTLHPGNHISCCLYFHTTYASLYICVKHRRVTKTAPHPTPLYTPHIYNDVPLRRIYADSHIHHIQLMISLYSFAQRHVA